MSRNRMLAALVLLLCLCAAPLALAQYQPWGQDRDRDRDDRGPHWGRGQTPNSGACFYRDANFRGDYFCVRPGEDVRNLPSGFNDSISSVRVFGNSVITIYPDSNFRGQFLQFHQSVPNLQRYSEPGGRQGWNDRISSIRIQGGNSWTGTHPAGNWGGNQPGGELWNQKRQPHDGACFYTDAKYRGDYFCLGLGQQIPGLPPQFNDRLTSVRIFGRARVRFWQDGGFQGVSADTDRSVDDLRRWRDNGRWNDQISSIMVQ